MLWHSGVNSWRWRRHSNPDNTWRVYSYLMANDYEVGYGTLTTTMAKVVPDVYRGCTSEPARGI